MYLFIKRKEKIHKVHIFTKNTRIWVYNEHFKLIELEKSSREFKAEIDSWKKKGWKTWAEFKEAQVLKSQREQQKRIYGIVERTTEGQDRMNKMISNSAQIFHSGRRAGKTSSMDKMLFHAANYGVDVARGPDIHAVAWLDGKGMIPSPDVFDPKTGEMFDFKTFQAGRRIGKTNLNHQIFLYNLFKSQKGEEMKECNHPECPQEKPDEKTEVIKDYFNQVKELRIAAGELHDYALSVEEAMEKAPNMANAITVERQFKLDEFTTKSKRIGQDWYLANKQVKNLYYK